MGCCTLGLSRLDAQQSWRVSWKFFWTGQVWPCSVPRKISRTARKSSEKKTQKSFVLEKASRQKSKDWKKPEAKQAAKPSETPESSQELPKEQAQKQKLPKPQPLLSPFWSTVSYPGHVSIFQRPKEWSSLLPMIQRKFASLHIFRVDFLRAPTHTPTTFTALPWKASLKIVIF